MQKLLTNEIEKKLINNYENTRAMTQEELDNARENKFIAKFFTPFSSFTWYALEYDPSNKCFFGYVTSHLCEGEYGYFSLAELEELQEMSKRNIKYTIERDLYFTEISQFDLIEKIKGKELV
ncbi:MAG: hypothetical protein Tp118DCM00d2C30442581_35 [Prokaryotic dsDNA virus sp.]|nr:MAG: hypothetical protein Tp118DCM00d2C30442581_35 [Prokaryotic dsDNA virus sp.]|tara:strand:- start:22535 stop:22900 length:366 start_codon:yes stop_codon:yes gene_type:complete